MEAFLFSFHLLLNTAFFGAKTKGKAYFQKVFNDELRDGFSTH